MADLGLPEELVLERLERCWWARRLRAAAEKAVAGGRVSEARPEEGAMPWRRSGRGVLWVMVAREAGTPWTWPDELAKLEDGKAVAARYCISPECASPNSNLG